MFSNAQLNRESNYVTYQKFNDMGLANAMAHKLQESNIDYQLYDDSKYFDVSFANNSFAADITLKIKQDDFIKADKALENQYKEDLAEVDRDYYLFSFSDDELKEIITKPDEWGSFDYQLAQQILKEKGKAIDPKEVALLKFRRVNELAEPETIKEFWIVLGYLTSVVLGFFTVLGGFIGIFIGWGLFYLKKTLPDGEVVHFYNQKTRVQGKYLLIFSSVISAFWYLLKFYLFNK